VKPQRCFSFVLAATPCLIAAPAVAATGDAAGAPLYFLGIPVDFILFGLTLLGVAVYHHHTLAVALSGLTAITIYKLAFTGFKFGPGSPGLPCTCSTSG
jgi:hypothetical protein